MIRRPAEPCAGRGRRSPGENEIRWTGPMKWTFRSKFCATWATGGCLARSSHTPKPGRHRIHLGYTLPANDCVHNKKDENIVRNLCVREVLAIAGGIAKVAFIELVAPARPQP